MTKNLVKVLDERFYIFVGAKEKEIENTLPKNWTEKGIYFVNCDEKQELLSVKDAEDSWNGITV